MLSRIAQVVAAAGVIALFGLPPILYVIPAGALIAFIIMDRKGYYA